MEKLVCCLISIYLLPLIIRIYFSSNLFLKANNHINLMQNEVHIFVLKNKKVVITDSYSIKIKKNLPLKKFKINSTIVDILIKIIATQLIEIKSINKIIIVHAIMKNINENLCFIHQINFFCNFIRNFVRLILKSRNFSPLIIRTCNMILKLNYTKLMKDKGLIRISTEWELIFNLIVVHFNGKLK